MFKFIMSTIVTISACALLAAGFPGNPITSAPTSAQGGSNVAVSGTSSTSGANVTATVSDLNGSISHGLSSSGRDFEITFTMPAYNPEDPDNVVTVVVKDGSCAQVITIAITP